MWHRLIIWGWYVDDDIKWLKSKNTSLIKKKDFKKNCFVLFLTRPTRPILSWCLIVFHILLQSRRRSTTYWHWDEDATKTRTLPRFHQYLHKPPLFFLSSYLFQGSAMKNNLIFLSQLSKVVSRFHRREFSPLLTGQDQRASMSILPTHTLL